MAIDAFVRRVLIDDDFFVRHQFGLIVTLGARHIGMSACQWEMSFGVVIECRGNPARGVVAVAAVRSVILSDYKLSVVCIFVAGFASLRRSLKTQLVGGGGFVAISACHGAMRSEQREFCFRVVEAVDVRPRFSGVASFASERRAIGPLAGHFFVEFAVVRVLVASGAVPILKFERQNLVGAPA